MVSQTTGDSVDRFVDELLEQWQHFIDNSNDFDPSLWFLAMDGDGDRRCMPLHRTKMIEDPEYGLGQPALRPQSLGVAGTWHGSAADRFHELYRRGKAGLVWAWMPPS